MKKNFSLTIFSILFLVLTLNLVSAVIVESVDAQEIKPGENGKVTLNVKNTLSDDIEDVSVVLVLGTTPFTTVGSSEDSEDGIKDGDKESFSFTLKSPNNIKPGDYNIPYSITYTVQDETAPTIKTGSFGITVSAETELGFAIETKDAVVGKQGKVSLEIINSGFGDLKSVSVKIEPDGFELLSKDKVFVGTVNAEDSDIVTWDVLFKETSSNLKATVTYKDFDNNVQTEIVNLPFTVYTKEKALELGLIKKNNTGIYIGVVIVLIVLWIVYRQARKYLRSRNKKKNGRN